MARGARFCTVASVARSFPHRFVTPFVCALLAIGVSACGGEARPLATTTAPTTTFGSAVQDPERTYCQEQLGEVRPTKAGFECVLGDGTVADGEEFAERGSLRATLLDLGRGVEKAVRVESAREPMPYAPAWSWEAVLRSPIPLRGAEVRLEDGGTGEFHVVRTPELGVVVGDFDELFSEGVSSMELREGSQVVCARFGERETPAVWSYGECR